MIIGKLWSALSAQLNKLANFFWTTDPIAQMQYEYDLAVNQMREGREGLEQQRALVERVSRMQANAQAKVNALETKVKALLQAGNRDAAGKLVLDLQKAKQDLAEYDGQYKEHEQIYNNNLIKIKMASDKLAKVRDKISKYDADLKMSRAEAEMGKLAQEFNFDVSTDFGQIEQVIQDKISLNKAKSRVAADLSAEGLDDIKVEQDIQKGMAEQVLREYEAQLGLVTPETAKVGAAAKELGPAATTKQTAT